MKTFIKTYQEFLLENQQQEGKYIITESIDPHGTVSTTQSNLEEAIKPIKGDDIVYDLGMRKIIDDIFVKKEYITQIPQNIMSNFERGYKILMNETDMDKSLLKDRYNRFKSRKFIQVYTDGKWDVVNKLNTNWVAQKKLLVELMLRWMKEDPKRAVPYYHSILENPKSTIWQLKDYLKSMIWRYFIQRGRGLDDFRDLMSSENIKKGEESEDKLEKNFIQNGYEIVYKGGDGDFIDMIFGVDFIVKHENDEKCKTVQIKYSLRSSDFEDYKHLDYLGEGKTMKIYDVKTELKTFLKDLRIRLEEEERLKEEQQKRLQEEKKLEEEKKRLKDEEEKESWIEYYQMREEEERKKEEEVLRQREEEFREYDL